MSIKLAGQTDTKELFEQTGVLGLSGQPSTQHAQTSQQGGSSSRGSRPSILAFVEHGGDMEVQVVNDPRNLLAYQDNTQVMIQWATPEGNDYFQSTVAQIKAAAKAQSGS